MSLLSRRVLSSANVISRSGLKTWKWRFDYLPQRLEVRGTISLAKWTDRLKLINWPPARVDLNDGLPFKWVIEIDNHLSHRLEHLTIHYRPVSMVKFRSWIVNVCSDIHIFLRRKTTRFYHLHLHNYGVCECPTFLCLAVRKICWRRKRNSVRAVEN